MFVHTGVHLSLTETKSGRLAFITTKVKVEKTMSWVWEGILTGFWNAETLHTFPRDLTGGFAAEANIIPS